VEQKHQDTARPAPERLAILVAGIVQGVGFRPYVHGLASRHALRGFVRNQTDGVLIEVEGPREAVRRFLEDLPREAPPRASITTLRSEPRAPRGEGGFTIDASAAAPRAEVYVAPDAATCDECLREMFDPADRRYRYPFLNCTRCGPRLTIIDGAPYDRERTSMAAFPMCPECRREYEDPADRRFHAEPTACPACGPRLEVILPDGAPVPGAGALETFVAGLRRGLIGAVEGLGGFHLVCEARSARAIEELRRRKGREEKPFAVMVPDVECAERICEVGPEERRLLLCPRRPIVLLKRRAGDAVVPAVAPGNPCLGLMLPYTPLHELLLREMGSPLVMTSGNRSDEPIVTGPAEALERLRGIADVFLAHDRPIRVRCDDSVTRVVDGIEMPLRRSRGYAPEPIALTKELRRPLLALGGQMKSVFALGRGRHAFLSHHIGDLDHYDAYRAFVAEIEHYERLFSIRPEGLVHDLHPDYASTRYARQRGLGAVAVQHHHAHMASCMADNDLDEPVIGVTFDGTGLGSDGTLWGGEFLVGDYLSFRRAAHLLPVPLPGGEQAIREPWRVAVSYLEAAGACAPSFERRLDPGAARAVRKMIERGLHAPLTSSAGRLWDAVASLAGLRLRATFEAQAAMELEWAATGEPQDGSYPFDLGHGDPVRIDTRPLIRAVAADVESGTPTARIARRFHTTLAGIIVRACSALRQTSAPGAVVLTGGVFQNALLCRETIFGLTAEGFRVYRHRRVPPNDGGLCLGQLAVAARSESAAAEEKDAHVPGHSR
jgi:hydrogenase maturation protein HypF